MNEETYEDRLKKQLFMWLNGKPIHNYVDDVCCPDFSCCVPSIFTKDYNDRKRTWFSYNHRKSYMILNPKQK